MDRLFGAVVLLAVIGLAGCADTGSPNGAIGQQAGNPTRHDLASNEQEAIPASDTFHDGFTVQGGFEVSYQIVMRDHSTVNIGFIRDQDLAEYQQGQQVTAWAFQTHTAGTSQSAVLPPGTYDLVISCANEFADCDVTFDLWATY